MSRGDTVSTSNDVEIARVALEEFTKELAKRHLEERLDRSEELQASKASRIAENTTAIRELVSKWIEKQGGSWFADNYLRIALAFEDDVSKQYDWYEFLRYSLPKDVTNDQRQLCEFYEALLQLRLTRPNKVLLVDWKSKHSKTAKRLDGKASRRRAIVMTACLLLSSWGLWSLLDWHLPFKIGAQVFAILVFLVVFALNVSSVTYENRLNSDFDARLEQYKTLVDQIRGYFNFLDMPKTEALRLRNAIFENKEYLLDEIFQEWSSNPKLSGSKGDVAVEHGIHTTKQIISNLDEILKKWAESATREPNFR